MKPRTLGLVLASIAFVLLTGCSSSQVRGVVRAGEVSTVLIVGSDDERLSSGGIPDVEVQVSANYLGANERSHSATTGAAGKFAVHFGRGVELQDPVRVVVRTDGYLPARVTTPVPPSDKRLLVILKPISP